MTTVIIRPIPTIQGTGRKQVKRWRLDGATLAQAKAFRVHFEGQRHRRPVFRVEVLSEDVPGRPVVRERPTGKVRDAGPAWEVTIVPSFTREADGTRRATFNCFASPLAPDEDPSWRF